MWEITLIYNDNKICYIDFIYNKLNSQVRFVGGVIVKQTSFGRAKISLAVPKKQKDYFVLLLLELVSEVITQDFKFEFLSSHLNIPIHSELSKLAFIKALTVFDKQTDKDLIKKSLIFEKELNIDSLYYFKLQSLKTRWADICSLVTDNFISLQTSGGLSELIKFLIKTADINYDEVHVYEKNKKYYLYDRLNKPVDVFSSKIAKDKESTLENLITLSPAKIVLHSSQKSDDPFYNYLMQLFEDKACLSV